MTMIRLMQISDTHLSPRTQHFRRNNDVMREAFSASAHDLIIHTGDITLDGVRYDEDHAFCRTFFDQFGKPFRFIPGNHDVGDNRRLAKPASENGSAIDDERLTRYVDHFDGDRWSSDLGAWRLIGVNSMLIGSGLRREAEQFDWIAERLESAGDRHIALFSHQPLFIDRPEPSELTYWTVDPSGNERLRPIIGDRRLKLIASGHLHQQRSRRYGDLRLEWGPSIAFTTHEALVPEMGGRREVGYVEHDLHPTGEIETRVLRAAGSENLYLDDMLEEVYPRA